MPGKKSPTKKSPTKKAPTKKASKKSASQAKSASKQLTASLPPLPAMESILASFSRGGRRSALDEAQDVMYEAWEAPTRREAVALARKALALSADCADALCFLAAETAKTLKEAIELYRQAVEAGKRGLGKKPFKEDVGYFWGFVETRPYMRARQALAESLWDAGEREEAVDHYWDMLRLNSNDNQGIRYLLMPNLIEMGRDDDAEKLFQRFPDECMAVWMYSRALLDFRKGGESSAANASLQKALKENKHVPAYLSGRKKMPATEPEYYGFGDDNEAVMYVRTNGGAWKATPGAVEWLTAKVKLP